MSGNRGDTQEKQREEDRQQLVRGLRPLGALLACAQGVKLTAALILANVSKQESFHTVKSQGKTTTPQVGEGLQETQTSVRGLGASSHFEASSHSEGSAASSHFEAVKKRLRPLPDPFLRSVASSRKHKIRFGNLEPAHTLKPGRTLKEVKPVHTLKR